MRKRGWIGTVELGASEKWVALWGVGFGFLLPWLLLGIFGYIFADRYD